LTTIAASVIFPVAVQAFPEHLAHLLPVSIRYRPIIDLIRLPVLPAKPWRNYFGN
jgi:hypothetical protein